VDQAAIGRDLGKMQAQISALQRENQQAHEERKAIAKDVKMIAVTMAEAKGGWRVLLVVGSAMAAVASSLTAMVVKWWP